MKKTKYRKVHIGGKEWKYQMGKRFLHIRSPDSKTINVEKPTFFIAIFGESEYKEMDENSQKWSRYSWDKGCVPSDFDIGPLLYFGPSMVKQYIEKYLIGEPLA